MTVPARPGGTIRALCLGAAAFLCCASVRADVVSVEIDGIGDEMLRSARSNLELAEYENREVSPAQVRRLFERAEGEIRVAMQAFGYYEAQVEATLSRPGEGAFQAVFQVTPGEPVTVRDLHLEVSGPAADLEPVRHSLQLFHPTVGKRLDHGEYERSKERVKAALRANGFLDAELIRHRVAVTRSKNSAEIDLVWDAGARHRFGAVRFSDTQFDQGFLRGYIPWPDDGVTYYSTDLLLTLQQRLVDAGYFSVVAVTPDLGHSRNGIVPIDVLLVPASRNVYSASLYASTDFGPGGRLGFERRWLNDRGHKLGAEIEYSQRLQQASVDYRIPRPGPQNRNYSFGVAYRDEVTDTSRSHIARIASSEVRDHWNGFTRTLGLQYLEGDFEIADGEGSTGLLYADGLLVRKHSDDPYFPTGGYRLIYGLRLASESLLSDTSLAQLRVDAKWLQQVGQSGRVILRASLGAMAVEDFDALPPELRFFAGGDRSIRGFGYQEIGESNAAGGVIGGEYLGIASAEYEHYFGGNWGAAVFVDAGDAFRSEFDLNVGTGIGLRWKSPVGLVRLDLARPVISDFEHSWRLHLIMGLDL